MDRFTIANAIETLEELNKALVEAYWDANEIYQKDTLFDILDIIHAEQNELAKLSIEDHSMAYEPVSVQFPRCARKFKDLQNKVDDWFPRTSTASMLHSNLASATNLISPKYL